MSEASINFLQKSLALFAALITAFLLAGNVTNVSQRARHVIRATDAGHVDDPRRQFVIWVCGEVSHVGLTCFSLAATSAKLSRGDTHELTVGVATRPPLLLEQH